MIATLIGAGIGLAGSLIGAANSKKQADKAEAKLSEQQAAAKARYDRLYNEDPTQTAAAQGALTAAREEALRMVRQARGIDATAGGNSNQAMASAQQAAGRMMADTTSAIAASGQARKDAIDSEYQQRADALSQRYYDLYNQRAANSAAAGSAALKAGTDIIGADMQASLNDGKGLFAEVFKKDR